MKAYAGLILRLILTLLLAAAPRPLHAEDKAAELRARLASAATQSSLDTPGLAPWHLKLDVQLFDDKGSPAEKGTVETWWLNPTDVQTTYTFPTYTATEVLSPTGTRRTKAAGLPPDAVSIVLRQIIHPMPEQADIDHATPDLRKQVFSKVPLECIMLDQPILNHSYPPIEPPLGLFPTFCFDPGQNMLRLSYDYGSELTIRNAIGKFQGRQVATSLSLRENGFEAASAHIAKLQSDPNLKAPTVDEATLELPATMPTVPATTMGTLVQRPNPVYPDSAKQRHASGTVVIHAIIGRYRHVRSMRLVKVPDADLAIAAILAVRGWVYKPYMLNGEPTEVDTTITVNFRFG